MEIPDNSTPLTEFEHIGSLNFIRERMGSLMNENDVLRQRIIDMEVSMAMVQTAQSWDVSQMTPDQYRRLKDITNILKATKKAKFEAFEAAKQGTVAHLHSRIRLLEKDLEDSKKENGALKEQLTASFHYMRCMREERRQAEDKQKEERKAFSYAHQELIHQHRTEMEAVSESCSRERSNMNQTVEQNNDFGNRILAQLDDLEIKLQNTRALSDENETKISPPSPSINFQKNSTLLTSQNIRSTNSLSPQNLKNKVILPSNVLDKIEDELLSYQIVHSQRVSPSHHNQNAISLSPKQIIEDRIEKNRKSMANHLLDNSFNPVSPAYHPFISKKSLNDHESSFKNLKDNSPVSGLTTYKKLLANNNFNLGSGNSPGNKVGRTTMLN